MTGIMSEYSASRSVPPAVEPKAGFSLGIRLYAGFEQVVDFRRPGVAVLGLDECPPRGNGWGPSPTHLLGAALGACLGAALLERLRAQGLDVRDMRTEVSGSVTRDTQGPRRIGRIAVRLTPILHGDSPVQMPAVNDLLRESVVAQSLGEGVQVELSIVPERRPRLDQLAADSRASFTSAAPRVVADARPSTPAPG
jgi:uncharacterized OsmC-like protein